ncbi:hypothetical protein [Thalassospira marina]|uniref:Uncharacterized protein n=1 Tax=Thalassospira marina TaxID=2048283 RepID=A0A2N3KXF5_9PROT|nr:hypothetical protein [Thalassospira marina]PKR55249.1 hypothetical protein COO20_03450 [Thalassospira marina]
MMTQTMNPQQNTILTSQHARHSGADAKPGLLRRICNALAPRPQGTQETRSLEKLDEMILRDVTGLSRAQLDIALRLPENLARREIARQMRRH